jgi:hypothetical protein
MGLGGSWQVVARDGCPFWYIDAASSGQYEYHSPVALEGTLCGVRCSQLLRDVSAISRSQLIKKSSHNRTKGLRAQAVESRAFYGLRVREHPCQFRHDGLSSGTYLKSP